MSARVYTIAVIDPDPIFRLGLCRTLEALPDFRVGLEGETAAMIWQGLAESRIVLAADPQRRAESSAQLMAVPVAIDGVLLDPYTPNDPSGLEWCQQLKSAYPSLPILVITGSWSEATRLQALQLGINGYCPKGTPIPELIHAIRQVVTGQRYLARSIASARSSTLLPGRISNLLANWREQTRRSGLRQIEAAINEMTAQLQRDQPLLDRLILAGRRRELRVASWCVNQLLASHNAVETMPIAPMPGPDFSRQPQPIGAASGPLRLVESPTSPTPAQSKTLEAALLDVTFAKLQFSLQNLTTVPLEIDLLREEKKRELLTIGLRAFEELLSDLRFSQVSVAQLMGQQSLILRDLWQKTTTEFFGRYSTLELDRAQRVEIVPTLLQDQAFVQTAILDKIPLVATLLEHLLFQTPLAIDNELCSAGSIEAMQRAEALLQNLLLQVANAVIQPLLNHFADVEAIKRNFYDRRFLSTREIERFRNHLSWRYRIERYVDEPTAIFESRFSLFALTETGIQKLPIYAPRRSELEQLTGIPFTVTLLLETRDAIAPRVRSTIAFLGSGLVYILTDVLGRGLGLIGRGILQGLGNVWRDERR